MVKWAAQGHVAARPRSPHRGLRLPADFGGGGRRLPPVTGGGGHQVRKGKPLGCLVLGRASLDYLLPAGCLCFVDDTPRHFPVPCDLVRSATPQEAFFRDWSIERMATNVQALLEGTSLDELRGHQSITVLKSSATVEQALKVRYCKAIWRPMGRFEGVEG